MAMLMPTSIINIRYFEYIISKGKSTLPPNELGIFKYNGKAPNDHLTPSDNNNMRAKVAKTWSKWSLLYKRLIIRISIKTPAIAAAAKLANNANQKEPVKPAIIAAAKAPII